MLKCRLYLGEIPHKDKVYPGLHPPLVDRAIWDRAQALLSGNLQGERAGGNRANMSLLAGRIVDEAGGPLVAVHATSGKIRYRYYVARALQQGESAQGARVPAREIEAPVCERLAALFDDVVMLLGEEWLVVPADDYARASGAAGVLAARIKAREPDLVRRLVTEVRIERTGFVATCSTAAIAEALGGGLAAKAPATLALSSSVRLTRTGRTMRLVDARGAVSGGIEDPAVIRLLATAHRYWSELRAGELDVTTLAAREGVTPSYLTRVLRLAFLAPDVTEALLAGRQRAGVNRAMILATGAIDADWKPQRRALLPGRA